MRFPIIECREDNLFILNFFEGILSEKEAIRPFNVRRNLTRYVIDSNGTVWSFKHQSHNNTGFRKLISLIYNISTENYSIEISKNKNIGWLKDLLNEYASSDNPDVSDLANSIIEDISDINNDNQLTDVMINLIL